MAFSENCLSLPKYFRARLNILFSGKSIYFGSTCLFEELRDDAKGRAFLRQVLQEKHLPESFVQLTKDPKVVS